MLIVPSTTGADDEEDKEIDPIVFTGKAKEIDDSLGGALTELAAENSKVSCDKIFRAGFARAVYI